MNKVWLALALALAAPPPASAQPAGSLLTGEAAYGDWRSDAPGVRRLLRAEDLPAPYVTPSSSNGPRAARLPANPALRVPDGFEVTLWAQGLEAPRIMRVAPNGDVFVAGTAAGTIRVLRTPPGQATPGPSSLFAAGLDAPFGLAFYPAENPRWLYVGTSGAVLRFPYRTGDQVASAGPERVVDLAISEGGHATRDLAFSPDGARLYVSVGSQSNAAEGDPPPARDRLPRLAKGASAGDETRRADVLVFDPEGRNGRVFATGLRNCVGLAVARPAGDVYCSTNERDGLGDNLPPDYVTRVREGGFYGWPWFYTGGHEDPRHKGQRPDLAGEAIVPDVLIQPHSAPLGMALYAASAGAPAAFPASYAGSAFAALHGSWNRGRRTGYKVVRIPLENGVPTGVYEDFLTGFVNNDRSVWGRPVGITVAPDGALLVSEDENGTIWRVAPKP